MKKENIFLGIHYGHDATVVLVKDGAVLEAMSEERLSRQKKYAGFPHLSLEYIKKKYDLVNSDILSVCVVGGLRHLGATLFQTLEENKKAREGLLRPKYYLRSLGFRFPLLGKVFSVRDSVLSLKNETRGVAESVEFFLKQQFPLATINYIHHHDAHAFAALPFISDHSKKRLIFTLDGAGDDASGSVSLYENGNMTLLRRFSIPHSLGLLYSAVVDVLGMKRNEHEFKVMGLAPYAKAESGEKVYKKLSKLLWFNRKTMQIEASFDTRQATAYMIAKEFTIDHRFDSLAYGVQKITEEVIKEMIVCYIKEHHVADIVIGGGVFMNVKANQKVLELPEVASLVSIPSCGDESLAIGAAFCEYAKQCGVKDLSMVSNIYWGSEYSDSYIGKVITASKLAERYHVDYFDSKKGNMVEKKVAELLAGNSVVGRFSGRAEWGARALGNRSILANPSSTDNVKLINEMIKNRDFWMPFATSLLEEHKEKYLVIKKEVDAPYMSITYDTKVRAHTEIIAALHPYDYTSRPQLVSKRMNPKYHYLISEFEKITSISGILNTSFNLHGEPNVESPEDAIRTFELSGLPHLALGNYLISKK